MKLKSFAELGSVYRTEPCLEYPGTYFVYRNGNDEKSFPSLKEAWDYVLTDLSEFEGEVSICWQCSDDDPRIGQGWFTGFYRLD